MAPNKRKALAVSRTTRSKASSSSQQPIPMEVQNPSHDDDHTSGAKQPPTLKSHTKKAILEAIKDKQVKASAQNSQKSASEDSKEESESSSEDDCDEEKLSEIVKGVCSGIKTKEPAVPSLHKLTFEEPISTSQIERSDDDSSDSQEKQSPKKAIVEANEVSEEESESSDDDSEDDSEDNEKQCEMVKEVSVGVKRKEPAVAASLQYQADGTEAVDTKIQKLKRLKLELDQMRTQLVKKQCEGLVKSFSMK